MNKEDLFILQLNFTELIDYDNVINSLFENFVYFFDPINNVDRLHEKSVFLKNKNIGDVEKATFNRDFF